MLKLILSVYVVFLPSLVLCQLKYGQHFPNGKAAVDYIYGPEGMFKRMNPLKYTWNYYDFKNDAMKKQFYDENDDKKHPFGKNELIRDANGSAFFTTRDANGHLLCDTNNDLVVDKTDCGNAF